MRNYIPRRGAIAIFCLSVEKIGEYGIILNIETKICFKQFISALFRICIMKKRVFYTELSYVLGLIIMAFGVFKGIEIGTVVCALVNGFLISRFSKLLEKHFDFRNKFKIRKYFE